MVVGKGDSGGDGRTVTVLHVDDDPAFTARTAEALEAEGGDLQVVTEHDTDAALERLSETHVDCIVSAYEMDDRDGLEFYETVAATHDDLPFILFTGAGSEDVASAAISAGVTDYLQKGTGPEQYALLAKRIENAVSSDRETTNYREIFDEVTEGIIVHHPETGAIEDANRTFCTLLGYDREAVLEMTVGEFSATELGYTQERAGQRIEAAATTGREVFEWAVERRDGETVHVEVSLKLTSIDGRERVLALIRDVTNRHQRERRLRELQTCTERLMHSETVSETGQIAVDAARDIIEVPLCGFNVVDDAGDALVPVAFLDTVRDELGSPPTYERSGESAADRVVWEVFGVGETRVITDISDLPDLATETPARSVIIHPLADRGVFIVSSTEPEAFDETDQLLVEILATALSTALRRVEREQLLRDRELALEAENERLDTFARVVSHDLRNPLNVAAGRVDIVRETADNEHLVAASRALDRMERLVDDLLTLARKGNRSIDTEPVSLASAATEASAMVSGATVDVTLPADATVFGDPNQFQQLFENLFRNSVEHSSTSRGGGSRPEDSADKDPPTADEPVAVTVGLLDDDSGFFVADEGEGIPEDERDRVFDVGYSTRTNGTGLGLTIVRSIADRHGWDVRLVESDAGGARFEFAGVEFRE